MIKHFINLLVLSCLLGCDFQTPNGNLFPLAPSSSQIRYPAIVIPDNFSPSPLSETEVKTLELSRNRIVRLGLSDNRVINIQLEELSNLNSFFKSNTSTEGTKFLGEIEGYTPGMTVEEYVDQGIQIVLNDAKKYPVEYLKELRNEIVSWIFSLQLIKSRCNTAELTEECRIISNISDKYLFMREEVIRITNEKAKDNLSQ